MVRLWYSNHLERLVEALTGNLASLERAGRRDRFDPVHLIVPNRNIATYLKFEIARRTGIAANFHVDYLYRYFRDAIPASHDDVILLSKPVLHSLLLDALADDEVMAHPELRTVVEYLEVAVDDDAYDRRCFQLAGQLARLFDEYALSRQRMIELWPSRRVIETEPYRRTERWQRRLWLEIFGEGKRLDQVRQETGRRFVPLSRLLEVVPLEKLELPAHTHVFGLSYIGLAFYKLFYEISSRTELFFYTLNPCMEYWEDVPAGWRLPHRPQFERRDREQVMLVFDEDEEVEDDSPPALRAWGRPGRDNIHLLNMLTECDFEPCFVDPMADGDSLLHRLQRDILVREPVRFEPEREYDDDSITFLQCPNIQREVEIVASEIWSLMRAYRERGEELRFNEIAVIVNNGQREAYQARIRSVFQNTYDIPHNIIDITATTHRRFLEAVSLLTSLPFGRFTRRDLLRLLAHPNVVAGSSAADPDTWVRWCDELNILHGADHDDHAGTYIEQDLYNWDQGLKRLALGAFMAGELAGDRRVVSLGSSEYLPYEVEQQEVFTAARLVTLARSLIADARWMASAKMPLREWVEMITRLITTYLCPADDNDEYDRMRCIERLRAVAELDLSDRPVSYRIAHEFVTAELSTLEISRGQYLAEGVVVSSFLPMRPIPFKVVFITGLGEKHFPRSDPKSPLDLRWAPEFKLPRGDALSARAQDEYMFLETLVSTRDRLYLSYVARDSQTGEDLEPSSVIRQLQFMLEQNYVTKENLARRIVSHRLRRYDEAYFPELFEDGDPADVVIHPEARAEAQMALLRARLHEHCEKIDVDPPALEAVCELLEADDWDRLCARLRLFPVPEPPRRDGEVERVEVSLSQIRKFLESPLQGAAQFFLRLRDEEFEDVYARQDELFEMGNTEAFRVLREVMLRHLHARVEGEDRLEEIYAAYTRRLELSGQAPTGPFRDAEKVRHLRVVRQWEENLWRMGIDRRSPVEVVRFGSVADDAFVTTAGAPLSLTIELEGEQGRRNVEVDIVGVTEPFFPKEHTSLRLTRTKYIGRNGDAETKFLRGFVDFVVLTAAGLVSLGEDDMWCTFVNARTNAKPDEHARLFKPFSQEDAQAYLETILEDMIGSMHAYLLPAEAVFDHYLTGYSRSLERIVDDKRDSRWASFNFGPIRHPERFDVPPDASAIVRRRFKAYFDRRSSE